MPFLFAVFHSRLTAFVVGTAATFGDAGGGNLGDDVLQTVGLADSETRTGDVADSAASHTLLYHFLVGSQIDAGFSSQPHPVAKHTTTAMGEIE